MTAFSLRFPEQQLARWASEYDYPGEAELIAGPVAIAKTQGYLDMQTFMAIPMRSSDALFRRELTLA